MRKLSVILPTLLAACWCTAVLATEKSDLRVLYVGVNPETAQLSDMESTFQTAPDRLLEFKKARTPSFERFLSQHFSVVDVVFADAYTEAASDGYDVTIFGDDITPIKEAVREQNEDGSWLYEPALYLTAEFDRAAILIDTMSPRVSLPLEHKMDWLCLCLDAHAHNLEQEHPVFNVPNKVELTFTEEETPSNYFEYHVGRDLPDSLPMWRVQTEGYKDGDGFPIGMVSHGHGFVEAGDSEVIASGVNTKLSNAVALGRHGNLFHWGFAAAPDEMTDEAKLVFVNAIHYIARFDGDRPYTRRQQGAFTRNIALDVSYRASKSEDSYQGYVDFLRMAKKSEEEFLRQKQETGQKLTISEQQILAREIEIPTREEFLEQRILGRLAPAVVERFGTDLEKYLEYYEANVEYLVPGTERLSYVVDADAASLETSNRDPVILDVAISLLEQDGENALARRVLDRYTEESFDTASGWREWFEANADHLYFAEVNGHKFEVAPERLR
ncbi:MAG: hypothetical protein OXP28_18880 [Gammaproteobacteria bacterium]|nr:hypothetical protein [Gammaproteobacteria bacterium]